MEAHKAKAGAIVVLDAKTGEILALANLPSYNPNNRVKLNRNSTRNRSITDIFEPGSTMKPFTIAAALGSGKFKPDSMIETAPGYFSIGPATIHDAHPEGLLSVAQVIQKSSNVGAAKIALTLQPEYLWSTFNHMGFGQVPHSGFPGEASGKAAPLQDLAPHRAGHHGLRPRHFGQPAATGARLHRVCQRWRTETPFNAEAG